MYIHSVTVSYTHLDKVPKYTSNSDFTVIRLAEKLGFVALIPELIARAVIDLFDVDFRPIDVDVTREIGFAVRDVKRVSPAVRQLLKYAKDVEL